MRASRKTHMQSLTEQLKRLGLSENEAKIYGVLLERSPVSAAMIARACGLSRSTVYTCLNELMGKGAVKVSQKNGVKQFLAEEADVLDRLLEAQARSVAEKRAYFQEIGPRLRALGSKDTQIPRIVSFEGQEGLKRAYMAMMRQAPAGATLYLARDPFVWLPEWGFVFERDWHDRIKRLKTEKRVTTKLLVNDAPLERGKRGFYAQKKGLEVRYLALPATLHAFAFYLLGDTVNVLSFERGNLLGTTITNQSIAQNFQALFESWWQAAQA